MTNNEPQKNTENAAPAVPATAAAPAKQHTAKPSFQGGNNNRGFRKNPRKGPSRDARARPEFDQKIIDIRRVTRVSAGGKRFNFSVAMIAGNRNGSVGVGLGKGGDTAIAIDKAFRNAKRNMINLKLKPGNTIAHEVYAKYSSARVTVMPAKGRGVIAGSAARHVIELGGVRDVNAKLLSPTKNQLNIARAMLKALSFFASNKVPNKIR